MATSLSFMSLTETFFRRVAKYPLRSNFPGQYTPNHFGAPFARAKLNAIPGISSNFSSRTYSAVVSQCFSVGVGGKANLSTAKADATEVVVSSRWAQRREEPSSAGSGGARQAHQEKLRAKDPKQAPAIAGAVWNFSVVR